MRLSPARIRRQRAQMDEKLKEARKLQHYQRPVGGWLRAIRESLGMSASALGRRLGVSKQAVQAFEAGEKRGSITLESLESLAGAMGCRFVYAVVPERSLEETVKTQARLAALRNLKRTTHSMALEAQGTTAAVDERHAQELADELVRKASSSIWEEGA